MSAIYNELDAYPAQWIRNLIAANLVAPGVVDGRSIKELTPDDVAGNGQRHFFAGIGVWSLALRMAGVPDDASVWTGSCPCQPFSAAGLGGGTEDERHLWPEWFRLIRESRPAVILGEQVASPDGLGWLDSVRADLEGEGYSFGAADLCAASVGAPHIRQRLFFGARRMGNTGRAGLAQQLSKQRALREASDAHARQAPQRTVTSAPGAWSTKERLSCRDGRERPTQPGLQPLAHGAASRVGRLRAYGNAIVPQVAATFVRAFMEAA